MVIDRDYALLLRQPHDYYLTVKEGGSMEKEKSLLAVAKEVIVVVREGLIILVVLVLFLSPSLVKKTLTSAGFTKASFAGWEWEREVKAAKQQVEKAKGQLAEVQEKFDDVNTELKQIKASVRPDERARIEKITQDIELSREQTEVIQKELSLTIQRQDNLLQKTMQLEPQKRIR